MTVLYYDCFSGISGDMNLGAMIDLGVDPKSLVDQLSRLDLSGYEMKITKDQRKGISGTKVDVVIDEIPHDHGHNHDHQNHRNLEDISRIIQGSDLSQAVKDRSIMMFRKLAEAEGKIHNQPIEEVHFHEVGATDSIVDIVGAAICIESIAPDMIMSSAVELGGGFVKCEHGIFPVPAPATAEILAGIPVKSGAAPYEMTTPTGALILACNAVKFGPMQDLRISRTAYGIGNRDMDIPNVLRVHLAESTGHANGLPETRKALVMECNIDDMNPEMYGYVMEILFGLGADDVFITPVMMKKARPASKLTVLCSPDKKQTMTETLLTHTTSLGVRSYEVDKTMLEREFTKIQTKYGEVTVKTAIYRGKHLKSKPEYEDCIRLAKEHGIPVQKIYDEISRQLNNGE
ncbi:MAG: hypothetical protein AMS26_16800 [Bacteroides sp. SM23_62]|nr:MAG: hypothetical protein AMS26_16800 [Bacteroides sp. SM23_62]